MNNDGVYLLDVDGFLDFVDKMTEFYGLYGAKYTPKEMEKAYNKYADEELEATYKKMKGKNGISCVDDAEIQLEKVFQRLFTEKGVDADIALATHAGQMFRVISMKFEKVYDGVFELLDTLKKKGKKIYLLSNAQYIFTGYEINALGLTPYFDGIVISSNECCKKPSKEFYNVVIERYGLKKEETVMVGNDQYADIQDIMFILRYHQSILKVSAQQTLKCSMEI